MVIFQRLLLDANFRFTKEPSLRLNNRVVSGTFLFRCRCINESGLIVVHA